MGSVERLAMGSLVMCLVTGRWIFPERSVVNLLKDLSSTLQKSSKVRGRIQFFHIAARIGILVPKFAFGAVFFFWFSNVNVRRVLSWRSAGIRVLRDSGGGLAVVEAECAHQDG